MAVNNIQFTKIELEIVKFIFKHFKDRFNSRQLSKLLNINHAHANKLCGQLEEKNLLLKEQIGNSIYFTFNYSSKQAIQFMDYLLSIETKEFPKWLAVLLHNLEKFKAHIHLGLVFGSSLQNKDFNDIDVLLVYDSNSAKNIKMIKDEIRKSGLTEKPIRYMDISEKDIFSNKNDKIFYSILSDNLIFYNSSKYIEVVEKCLK
jgi:hypothetical protein